MALFSSGGVVVIKTKADCDALIAKNVPAILFFWADWHEPSKPGGQMDQVVSALAAQHGPSVALAKVEAEAVPELSARYKIEVVPSFVYLRVGGTVVDKLEGANAPEVARLTAMLVAEAAEVKLGEPDDALSAEEAMESRLSGLIRAAPVMLFMKGCADEPKCKFSRQMVGILTEEIIEFGTFDILQDEDVRQALKKYSNWPTYPQLYVRGELIGGLDIVKELRSAGGLKAELGLGVPPAAVGAGRAPEAAAPEPAAPEPAAQAPVGSLDDRLRTLIGQSPNVLFMKGSPDEPRCGFSSKIVGILKEENIAFTHFDILTDEEVRQGLKKFSNWPTYPQFYMNGELVGGLDIIQEMRSSGELASMQ